MAFHVRKKLVLIPLGVLGLAAAVLFGLDRSGKVPLAWLPGSPATTRALISQLRRTACASAAGSRASRPSGTRGPTAPAPGVRR